MVRGFLKCSNSGGPRIADGGTLRLGRGEGRNSSILSVSGTGSMSTEVIGRIAEYRVDDGGSVRVAGKYRQPARNGGQSPQALFVCGAAFCRCPFGRLEPRSARLNTLEIPRVEYGKPQQFVMGLKWRSWPIEQLQLGPEIQTKCEFRPCKCRHELLADDQSWRKEGENSPGWLSGTRLGPGNAGQGEKDQSGVFNRHNAPITVAGLRERPQ